MNTMDDDFLARRRRLQSFDLRTMCDVYISLL